MKKLGWVERRDKMEKVFPELIEACEQALGDLEPYEWIDLPGSEDSPGPYAVKETVDKLRKAIAKAEGIVYKTDPETELRASWTKQGVPKERQDELIREVEEKAKPGAKVGPFTIGE